MNLISSHPHKTYCIGKPSHTLKNAVPVILSTPVQAGIWPKRRQKLYVSGGYVISLYPHASGESCSSVTCPCKLNGNPKQHKVHSKIWWFTRYYKSHYISHFTTFFINLGTETSIAESCIKADRILYALGYFDKKNLKTDIAKPPKRLSVFWCNNDPSAGSPTETLLRLHLPLGDTVQASSPHKHKNASAEIPRLHRTIQSVGATGGVYKGQGRNQRRLMICIY